MDFLLRDRINRMPPAVAFGRRGSGGTGGGTAILPPGAPAEFETAAQAAASPIEQVVNHIRVAGHGAVTDGGTALYHRTAAVPAHAGRIQSADGAHWELVPDGGHVRVTQFGAVEGGDITTALQDAIDYACYGATALGTKPCVVLIDVNQGTLSDTIHLGWGNASFRGVIVRGLGKPYRVEGNSFMGTGLTSTVTDRPAFAVTMARNTRLEEFGLRGVAFDAISALDISGKSITEAATWDAALASAGVAPGARYAPHAAIAVDPYTGAKPAGAFPDNAYPDVVFPAFLGAAPGQYEKAGSSNTTVRNLAISGFEAGIVQTPADWDGNGDFLRIQDCEIERTKIAISVGNSQSRNVDISNLIAARVHSVISNRTHGKRSGSLGAVFHNLSIGEYATRIFDINQTAVSGQILFQNIYTESLHELGGFTGSALDQNSVSFLSGQIRFRHSDTGVCPPSVLRGNPIAPIVFVGVSFGGFGSVMSMQPWGIDMIGCAINDAALEPRSKSYQKVAHNAMVGGLALVPGRHGRIEVAFNPFNLDTGNPIGARIANRGYSDTDRRYCMPLYSAEVMRSGSFQQERDLVAGRPQAPFTWDRSQATAQSRTGRTVTFTHNDAAVTVPANAQQYGFMPGDVILDGATGTVLWIRSTNHATGEVVAELQNNYTPDGAGGWDLFDPSFDIASGSWSQLNARIYTPPRRIVGDLSSSSANISVWSMYGGTPANYGLSTDDYLYGEATSIETFNGGWDIQTIDTAARTITMPWNAGQTITGYVFDYWLRPAPANEASR